MHSVIIIGAGPAGMAAALQLKRYGVNTLLLEQNRPGGLLNNGFKIENYLGFPHGVGGKELVAQFVSQLANHKVKITKECVTGVDVTAKNSFLVTTDQRVYEVRRVVLATGTTPKSPATMQFLTHGIREKIFYDVVSLPKIKNSRIAIVGAGDAAFDYAVTLAQDNEVTIFNRGGDIKALLSLQKRVEANNKIKYLSNARLVKIDSIANCLKLAFEYSYSLTEYECDFLLFAIGREPAKQLYSNDLVAQETELITNQKLFLIGDVKNGNYRQTSLAVADGIRVAMDLKDLGAAEW